MSTTIYQYYVYAYINRRTGLPYYIGKGKDDRAYKPHNFVSVPKDKSKIVFLETNLSEVGAFAIERRMIEWWGRKCINTGILLNIAAGGEGPSGHVMTSGQKQKISESNKSRWSDPEHKTKWVNQQKKGVQEKHGVDTIMESDWFHEKAKETFRTKWGVENISQDPTIKAKKIQDRKAAAQRPIIKKIKELNGPRRKKIIQLGRGWYSKSDEYLEDILHQLTQHHSSVNLP